MIDKVKIPKKNCSGCSRRRKPLQRWWMLLWRGREHRKSLNRDNSIWKTSGREADRTASREGHSYRLAPAKYYYLSVWRYSLKQIWLRQFSPVFTCRGQWVFHQLLDVWRWTALHRYRPLQIMVLLQHQRYAEKQYIHLLHAQHGSLKQIVSNGVTTSVQNSTD